MLGHDGERLFTLGPERLGRVVRRQCLLDADGGDDLAPPHPVGEERGRRVHQFDLVGEREHGRLVEGFTSCVVAGLQAVEVHGGHDGDARVGEPPGCGETTVAARVDGR